MEDAYHIKETRPEVFRPCFFFRYPNVISFVFLYEYKKETNFYIGGKYFCNSSLLSFIFSRPDDSIPYHPLNPAS